MPDRIKERAFAKLNLALHVTGRGADGYHQLDSLVCFAAVGDEVTLTPGPLSLEIDGPFSENLSRNNNLCLKAAQLAGAKVQINLTKNLPIASGIGGGSADAAAVLRGLARLGYPLPKKPEQLGADVPVCLSSQAARMQGIGEQLTPLPSLPNLSLVLVNPGIAISTPQIFAALRRRDNPILREIPSFNSADSLINWLHQTRNDLEAPALQIAPVIAEVQNALTATGAKFARMSGSGATCFGIYDSPAAADNAANGMKKNGWWTVATELAQPSVAR